MNKRLLLYLFSIVILDGCCWGVMSCDCEDECVDCLLFELAEIDQSDSGFTVEELSKLMVIRLQSGTDSIVDSMEFVWEWHGYSTIIRQGKETHHFCGSRGNIVSLDPHMLAEEEEYTEFDYIIEVSPGNSFHLTDLVEDGETKGRCCGCYHSEVQSVFIDGQFHDLIQDGVPLLKRKN